jgi:hypothetical protein
MDKTVNNEVVNNEVKAPLVEQMPEQNGVRKPRENTHCARIWDIATQMSTEANSTVAVGDLIETAVNSGFNEATIKTQYARWRKFHGIEGRVESAVAAEKRMAAAQLKEDKLALREAAKLAKVEEKKAKAEAKAQLAKEKAEAKAQIAEAKAEAKAVKEAEKEAAKAAKLAAKAAADEEAAAEEAAKASAKAASEQAL